MNNTKILWKYMLLIFAVCLMSCGDNDEEKIVDPGIEVPTEPTIDFEVKAGMDLVGKVFDGATPLADILISDGYTITKTDNNGIYQMKKNDKAKFVFITIPNDCKVPTEGNIPAFYKKIDNTLKTNLANFSLNKSTKATNHILIAIADPQPSDLFEMERFSRETVEDIKSHITGFTDMPIYGITVGDIVWDRMDFFSRYINAVNKLSFPIFQVIGNHDHNEAVLEDDYSASADYEEYFGPTYYSYNIGDCHYVVLDDVYYMDRENYEGYITEEQLAWLKEDLKYVDKDKLIILGIHIPTKRRATSTAVTNNKDLYDLFAGYKVRIISGHTHYNFTTTISSGIEENTLGAASGAFWSGDLCPDGSPNGYAVYQITGNKITNWYYKGTTEEKDSQLKIYPLNSWTSKNDCILANVWSWNTDWKVEVFENGVSRGNMQSYTDYDPLAYLNLFGETIPARHPTAAEPAKTDHMFFYKPSADWATVKVKVTNPSGNIYEKEISK